VLRVVVETHPEDVVDLRLDSPWPELAKLASTINLDEMDDFEHAHVPYILILLNFLDQWKQLVSPFLQDNIARLPPSNERQKSIQ
jgi:hypothetical protein